MRPCAASVLERVDIGNHFLDTWTLHLFQDGARKVNVRAATTPTPLDDASEG